VSSDRNPQLEVYRAAVAVTLAEEGDWAANNEEDRPRKNCAVRGYCLLQTSPCCGQQWQIAESEITLTGYLFGYLNVHVLCRYRVCTYLISEPRGPIGFILGEHGPGHAGQLIR